jgi:hypothetical protein
MNFILFVLLFTALCGTVDAKLRKNAKKGRDVICSRATSD